jgi:hypothetical protein
MYLPVPPTLVRIKLGIPLALPRPVVFPASGCRTDSLPGVEQKREFWESKLCLCEPRPMCEQCKFVFRNLERLELHLEEKPSHRRRSSLLMAKDADNRDVIDCAMNCLDPSQKEFIELVLRGFHVILMAPAGYGKTLTLLILQEVFKILLGELGYNQFIGFCAPNNAQAAVLGGSTFNSFWNIGIGETEVTGEDLHATFLRGSAAQRRKDLKFFATDEAFKQPQIQTDFLALAMLHGLPIGTVNAFEVTESLFSSATFRYIFVST